MSDQTDWVQFIFIMGATWLIASLVIVAAINLSDRFRQWRSDQRHERHVRNYGIPLPRGLTDIGRL